MPTGSHGYVSQALQADYPAIGELLKTIFCYQVVVLQPYAAQFRIIYSRLNGEHHPSIQLDRINFCPQERLLVDVEPDAVSQVVWNLSGL